MAGNVLFVTVDQWRGDSLGLLGHPVLATPSIDQLARSGAVFANHWANTAPCGPSRASLYTGTYLHHHRSCLNGTPLDARFTNIALEARRAGYDPVLFGYTDTSVDPRAVRAGDPRLHSYEGVLPGFRPVVHDPYEAGGLEWGKWLAGRGRDVPSNPRLLYQPDMSFPGADEHGSTWAPAGFGPEETETAFLTEQVLDWLERSAGDPFFVHVSYIRPHPPYRNPPGYHDLYSAEDVPPFVAHPTREAEQAMHPLNAVLLGLPVLSAPADELERRQTRATYHGMQREVDDQLGRLFGYLAESRLDEDTLVVLTSDHGEMGGDHWLFEKAGYWDETYHIPLVVRDPRRSGLAPRRVDEFTESVDVAPTVLDWLGLEVPVEMDGWSLLPFLERGEAPEHWRQAVHFEWDFRNPELQLAERLLGVPSAHCLLNVTRDDHTKYVHFATDPAVLPPLLFDLEEDPGQLVDRSNDPGYGDLLAAAAQELLTWRMRNDDRVLANSLLSASAGLVEARDRWR